MLAGVIPETIDEARELVASAAASTPNTQIPGRYPHSQIVALAQTVEHLLERVEQLEAKRKPGRPAKIAGEMDAERVRAELAA